MTGRTVSRGAALGTAAVVRWAGGVAQLSPRILEEMAQVAKRGVVEPIEVVLVIEDPDRAASLTIPGVRVVGVIAEQASEASGAFACPALVGVVGAMTKIPDDVLVLLDADRGMALIDPDGATVAAYQAERERISPRRRIYIDFAHEPARTADGIVVRVCAVASSDEAILKACLAGADGILVPSSWAALQAPREENDLYAELTRQFRAADGKPVTVAADLETLSASALLRASTAADVTLALPVGLGEESMDQARIYLEQVGAELTEAEIDWRPVRLAALLPSEAEAPVPDSSLGCHRLVVDLADVWDVADPDRLDWLDSWSSAAAREMAPVEVIMPSGSLDSVPSVAALGASALYVAPEEVQNAKEALRRIAVGTVRASLFG